MSDRRAVTIVVDTCQGESAPRPDRYPATRRSNRTNRTHAASLAAPPSSASRGHCPDG